jgi:hypothetical protein
MEEEEKQKYREAADKLWELADQFHGFKVAEDIREFVGSLHAKAGGRKSIIILDGDE